jgi:hypothetical protein
MLLNEVPDGATLTGLSVNVTGQPTHTWPIAVLPTFQLWRRTLTGNYGMSIVDDPSTSAAEYDVMHTISITIPWGVLIDRTNCSYSAILTNERSTNATAGLVLNGGMVYYTLPAEIGRAK